MWLPLRVYGGGMAGGVLPGAGSGAGWDGGDGMTRAPSGDEGRRAWAPIRGAPTRGMAGLRVFGDADLGTHKGAPSWHVWGWRARAPTGVPLRGYCGNEAPGGGEARVAAGRQFRIAHTLAAAGGFRTGGVAGAEPPHKGGPNRPDRTELQWSVVSGGPTRRGGEWGGLFHRVGGRFL